MSTAANFAFQESTMSADQNNNQDNMYRHGRSGTDPLPSEDPEIIPRSPRILAPVTLDNKIEDIRQRWTGTVIDFDDKELTVRLEDSTNPENSEEIVVLSIDEIEFSDRSLIQLGAMFLWQIGYRYGHKYPRERFSKISFRRLPKWTKEEIEDAEKLAKDYADFFAADSTNTP